MAAAAWSRSAGRERMLDQPYARYLTRRSFWPARSPQITVVRARSSRASVLHSTRPGTSISWSIAADIIRALLRVRCMRSAPVSVFS